MSRSFIYCANQSVQTIQENGIVSPGSVIRRFGCNCNLIGNGIELRGEGYYQIIASITLDPTATGGVTVTLLQDGTPITGAVATTAGEDVITLCIPTAVRLNCCCNNATAITCQLSAGASVSNYTIQIEKL